jgi:L-asparaginase II
VLPSDRYPRGLGLSFKMEDGSYRGLGPAVIETLRQMGVLDDAETTQLITYYRPEVENRRGVRVGEIRATFDLGINER